MNSEKSTEELSASNSTALLAVDPFKTLPLTFILKDSEWCYAESTKDIERQLKELCEKAMALGLNVTRTRLAGADEMVITIASSSADVLARGESATSITPKPQ